MYLIDTNVISELRRREKANLGVRAFFKEVDAEDARIYLSAISVGELRRGVDLVYHRGDVAQSKRLEAWLNGIVDEFYERILPFDSECAQVWGRLCAPNPEHAIDKQIAAIALVNDLIVVTRNVMDFSKTGVETNNPFRDNA